MPGGTPPPDAAPAEHTAAGRPPARPAAVPDSIDAARLKATPRGEWYEEPPEAAFEEPADPERQWLDGLPDGTWAVWPGKTKNGTGLAKARKTVRHITPIKPANGGRFEARVYRQPGTANRWRVMVRHIPGPDATGGTPPAPGMPTVGETAGA